ncbi:MAG: hypothetical protein GY762_05720 [Proteobacteria bacterium]|nr:hypothetical protein [Pseudomonadota bacterium]
MKNQQFSNESPDIRKYLWALRGAVGLGKQKDSAPRALDDERHAVATEALLDAAPGAAVPGFDERQIGTWDLVDVSYLERGATVARAVCKLHACDAEGPYVGTGFLVSPRLLVTNEHNLPTKAIAASAFVEFEHELGPDGLPRNSQRFVLKPDEAYWVDEDLDVCVVAVAPLSRSNTPLSRYGFLRLDPTAGKAQPKQFITIIHHPNGDWKQVALRENQLLKLDDDVLWYATDTCPGSSGAPCFSDRWQVVALHRRGIPRTKEGDDDLIALTNGEYVTRRQIKALRISDRDIQWLANEGARISVFLKKVGADQSIATNPLIVAWLSDLGSPRFTTTPTGTITVVDAPELDENRRPDSNYEKRNGFQHDFLGIDIPAPGLDGAVEKWGHATYNSDTGETEFPYYNFSIWMSRERRLAFLAAVNIDGENHNARRRKEFGSDKWEYDDRLPKRGQVGNWFYGNEPARYNRNYFDRGHIVRRVEPSWGLTEISQLANDDTFHWTNCSPQYKSFNQQSRYWQGLEDYLLEDGAVRHRKRMLLFSGPIFSEDDTEHRSVLVPKEFFKVAVFVDEGCKLRSAAYILDQSKWVDVIDFERAAQLDVRTVRRSIKWLEERTGLDFGDAVRSADAAAGLGSDFAAIRNLPDLFA